MKSIPFYLLALLALVTLSTCTGLTITDLENLFGFPEIAQANAPVPGQQWDRVKQVDNNVLTIEPGSGLAKLTSQVRKNPEKYLRQLVEELVSGRDDGFQKVKAIHDWIALNIGYDAEAYFKGSHPVTDPYGVLRRGASVCAGYAQLFTAMCGLAEIRSVVITGHGRGYDWSPYREKGFESNHAWNGVEIEGGWYLVDCTWDAGHVTDDTFTSDYDISYFCTPPAGFLHTHFPDNPAWQLLDDPISYNEYCEIPYLNGIFFKWGLSVGPELRVLNRVDDQAAIRFGVPGEVTIHGIVINMDDVLGNTPGVMQKRTGESEEIVMVFPRPGRYYISLIARQKKDTGSKPLFEPIGLVYFEAASGSNKIYPFFSQEFQLFDVQIQSPVLPYDPGFSDPPVITLATGQDLDIDAMLFKQGDPVNKQPIRKRIFIQTRGSQKLVHVSFPEKGAYDLTIFYRVSTDSGSWTLNTLVRFPLIALKKTDFEFPRIDPNTGISIISPMYSPLKADTEAEFEVHAPDLKKIVIRINNVYKELKKEPGGRFYGRFKIEGDKAALFYEKKPNYYVLIAEYDVE